MIMWYIPCRPEYRHLQTYGHLFGLNSYVQCVNKHPYKNRFSFLSLRANLCQYLNYTTDTENDQHIAKVTQKSSKHWTGLSRKSNSMQPKIYHAQLVCSYYSILPKCYMCVLALYKSPFCLLISKMGTRAQGPEFTVSLCGKTVDIDNLCKLLSYIYVQHVCSHLAMHWQGRSQSNDRILHSQLRHTLHSSSGTK